MYRLLGLLALTLMLSLASAQPLAALAPADSVVTISASRLPAVPDTLMSRLQGLDWERAGNTLQQLAETLGGSGFDELLGPLAAGGNPLDELAAACPELPTVLDGLDLLGDEALLTVSVSAFNPMPVVTALARYSGAQLEQARAAQAAVIACASTMAEVTTFEQDGVTMYLLGDGSDLPLLVAEIDGVMALSSNPDVLRGVIRRAKGASEPSLAATDLYQRSLALLGEGGFGLSLNTAALAEALTGLVGMIGNQPELELLTQRGLATLRTLGGLAGRLALTAEGIEVESLVAVNPDGGDAALAELLLCRDCAITTPLMAPQESVSVQAFNLPLLSLFDYLQGWLSELEPLVGEPLDLRQLALEMLGLELDAALFDWLGKEVYLIGLEPLGRDLGTLLYQPAQAWVFPVTSPEAAQAGLEMLGNALVPLAEMFASQAELPQSALQVASERYSYQGVEITRHRFSLNADIGVAYLGDFLMVGMPARALHPLIDSYRGAPNLLNNPEYSAAAARRPEAVSALSFRNDRQVVASLAELLELFGQPLAFALSAGLEEAQGDLEGEYGLFSPSGSATPLMAPTTHSGSFAAEAEVAAITYALSGLTPGTAVTITLTSAEFDTYLYLIDADSAQVIFENDDFPDTSTSQITFVPTAGITYWVQASSYGQYGSGGFTLTVAPATAEPDDLSWYTPYPLDLSGIEPEPLALGEVTGALFSGDYQAMTNYYQLLGLTPGERVTVTLSGDANLALADANRGVYLEAEMGYRPDGAVTLSFTVREGASYWLELQSYSVDAAPYAIDIAVSPATNVAAEPPPFADLLHLTELFPQALAIIAEHLSTSDGYSHLDGDSLYSRSLIRVAW